MKLHCQLIANVDFNHLQQLFTGFYLLKKQGIINAQEIIEKRELGLFEETHLKVRINNKINVLYDMHDSKNIRSECLEGIDFYFKRSFSSEYIEKFSVNDREKIYPFGFNYQVLTDGFDSFLLKRTSLYEGFSDKYKIILKSLGINKKGVISDLQAKPNFNIPPKIIFMARAWNPNMVEDKEVSEHIVEINKFRSKCIQALRKEFGKNFFGGLMIDEYSKEYFSDVLLPDNSLAIQKNYLNLLKNYPICVTTKGLWDSNGWKLAEYIAFSKAIVSEKIYYQVVGNFEKNSNYLEFCSVDELIQQTVKLYKNKELREQMMQNNYDYYQNYLRPDKIVWNTLEIIKKAI